MSIIDRIVAALNGRPSGDEIDAYFILSDMYEVEISDEERGQTAFYDSAARHTGGQCSGTIGNPNVPVGKQVG